MSAWVALRVAWVWVVLVVCGLAATWVVHLVHLVVHLVGRVLMLALVQALLLLMVPPPPCNHNTLRSPCLSSNGATYTMHDPTTSYY